MKFHIEDDSGPFAHERTDVEAFWVGGRVRVNVTQVRSGQKRFVSFDLSGEAREALAGVLMGERG